MPRLDLTGTILSLISSSVLTIFAGLWAFICLHDRAFTAGSLAIFSGILFCVVSIEDLENLLWYRTTYKMEKALENERAA